MPPWFIDIESATEMAPKSNGTPPASRTPAHAARANSPRSALQGVTRPSVDATPTNGFCKSSSVSPRPRRKARCGARSSPSTVMREGRMGIVLRAISLLQVFGDDFFEARAVREAELRGTLRARRFRRRIDDRLQRRIRSELHFAFGPAPYGVPHLLRADRYSRKEHGSVNAERLLRGLADADQVFHHA